MNSSYQKIIEKLGKSRVKINEPLALHTAFKIGGPADLFYEVRTIEEFFEAVKLARKYDIPFFILGGGSNVLVADEGFRGMVIKTGNTRYEIPASRAGRRDTKIIADAGVSLAKLVEAAAKNSLSGLEFAVGIPGTLGGAVVGNAGAWQENIGEKVLRVKILDKNGNSRWINQQDCQFAYRQSRFKDNQEIVLEVQLGLEKGDSEEIKRLMEVNLRKRENQPKQPSAGCIFVNPKPDSAGKLIDMCGLKGKKIGKAQISPQHANFIVNLGKAKASDVIQLIKLAKREVKKKFGVELKKEICLVGFDKIEAQ